MREAFMKKCLVVSIILFLFALLAACVDDKVLIPVTANSSAQPLLDTMTAIAKTVDVMAQTATFYSLSPTPTNTPTNTPDPGVLNKTISDAINSQLLSTFGAKIAVVTVKFGPIGAQEYTNLYIEMNCTGDNNTVCPTTQVMIAVMNALKDKKKKILENVPDKTQILTITIYDPGHSTIVAEANWPDVLDYINDKMPAENLSKRISYTPYR
jgi:hypothetical protein